MTTSTRIPRHPRLLPSEAEVETLVVSSGGRVYARLTNGQIIRRRATTVKGSFVFWLPGQVETLNPATIASFPQIGMSRG